MRARQNHAGGRVGFGRLELLLVVAFLSLLFQVFPSLWHALWHGTLWAIDVRNWPRWVWFVVNLAVVMVLFAIRFGPELLANRRKHRPLPKVNSEKRTKDLDLKEQRELFKRMQEARKRQII